MKSPRNLTLCALVLPVFFASCGEEAGESKGLVAQAAEKAKGLDLGSLDLENLTSEDMTSKVSELASTLVQKLGGVKDAAGAETAAVELGPLADQLGTLKDALGDNMPDMSSLGTAIESLTAKFGIDSDVIKTLQPVLEKLKGLMG